MAGAAPHRGRRKDVFVAVAEVEAAGHPAEPRSYLRQLPGHNRVRLDLESCHLTLRHLYVGASRATSSEPRTGSTAPPGAPA